MGTIVEGRRVGEMMELEQRKMYSSIKLVKNVNKENRAEIEINCFPDYDVSSTMLGTPCCPGK